MIGAGDRGDVSADHGAVIQGLVGPVRLFVSAKRQKVQAHLMQSGFTGRALTRRSAQVVPSAFGLFAILRRMHWSKEASGLGFAAQ